MKNIDFRELEQLLKTGHQEEAKTLLVDYFNSDITEEERGEVLTNMVLSYMRAETTLNLEYAQNLREIMESLKKIDQIEEENNKKIDITNLQNQIQSM